MKSLFGKYSKISTYKIYKRFNQCRYFRTITNARRYINNRTLHNDLNITSISDQASKLNNFFHKKLHHSNTHNSNQSSIELPNTTRTTRT